MYEILTLDSSEYKDNFFNLCVDFKNAYTYRKTSTKLIPIQNHLLISFL